MKEDSSGLGISSSLAPFSRPEKLASTKSKPELCCIGCFENNLQIKDHKNL